MAQLTNPQLAELRKPNHASDLFLAVLVPDDAMTAQVNGSQSRGETDIPYDNDSGEGDVLAGMIAWFGTTSGAKDIGIQRVKSINTGTNELTIEENDLTLLDDYYITVKKLWLPRAKLPDIDNSGADVVFLKDGETYTDEGENVPPVVVMGPPAAAEISGGTATVKFVDELSWSPVGAALSVVTWDFDGGSDTGGSGTIADPYVVTYASAGWYWVSLTITDDNGATSIGYRPIFIYDANDPPYMQFACGPRQSSQRGTQQSFTVYGTADQSQFPDNTWVIRFNVDWYGNDHSDIAEYEMDTRYPFRGNTKFVGFLDGDTLQTNTDVYTTSFEAIDITLVMDRLPGFGDRVTDTASPTKWTEIKDLDLVKAVLHVLRWSTTILDVADFDYDFARSSSEILVQEQRWGAASIFRQIDRLVSQEGIFANLCADIQGSLHLRQDPLLMDHTDRTTDLVTVADFTTSDYQQATIVRRHRVQLQHVRLSGIAYNGVLATPYQSYAPGVPDQNPSPQDVGGQILVDQVDTSRLAGDVFAKANNTYGQCTVVFPGNYDVFDPSLQERMTFPLATDENNRGLEFDTDDYWIVRNVTVNENAAGGFVDSVVVTVEYETEGVPGTGGTISEQPTWPTPDNPDDEPTPPRAAPDRYDGIIIVTDDGKVAYTTDDVIAENPGWTELDTSSISLGTVTDARIQQQSSGKQWVYLCDETRIYRHRIPRPGENWNADWDWESLITAAAMITAAGEATSTVQGVASLAISIEKDGWQWAFWYRKVVTAGTDNACFGVAHTRDNWQSIQSSVVIEDDAGNTNTVPLSQVTVDQNSDGLIVYVAASKFQYTAKLWRSTNGGGSWSVIDGSYAFVGAAANRPGHVYVALADSSYIYWDDGEDTYRSTNGGSSFAQIAAAISGEPHSIGGPHDDENVVTIMGVDDIYNWDSVGGLALQGAAGLGYTMTSFLPLDRNASTRLLNYVFWVGGDPIGTPKYEILDNSTDRSGDYATEISTEEVARVAVPELGELAGI